MKRTKFFTAIALAAALLFSACRKAEPNQTEVEGIPSTIDDWDDDGRESGALASYIYDEDTNTYTVYTADGLLAWNTAVQNDLTLNCTLANDIDLRGITYTWLLVGNYNNRYTGTFDGGDHTITELTINQSSSNNVGLIGWLGSGGKVQNLTLEDVNITGPGSYVGGVVGYNYEGTVTDCTISGSVTGGGSYVGGVVGQNYYGIVTDCTVSGNVSSSGGGNYVGGVVGYNEGYGTVTACSASGSVTGGGNYVGGVAGYNDNAGTVTECSVSSSVSSSALSLADIGYYFGGVVGYNYGTVIDCYSTGSVSGTFYVGGVVGYNDDGGIMTACYSTGSVSGYMYFGGVVGQNYYGGTVTACYSTGNVSKNEQYGYVAGGVVGWNYGGTVIACYSAGNVSSNNPLGGVAGQNDGSVIACYWSGYSGDGIGTNNVSGNATTFVSSWTNDIVNTMNSAISTSGWQYELTGSLPTLKKTN